MSYTQISLEKKKSIAMWTSFVAVQLAILFLGVMVGLWIVTLIRISEVSTNSQIALIRVFAIVFTVLTALAAITTIIAYVLYIKYRNLLDGFVDQSLKNIQKEKKVEANKQQNINIKLTTPVAQPATPIVKKTVPSGPVKKIVTTTTTTTSKPGTVVRTINTIPNKQGGVETKKGFFGMKNMFKKPISSTKPSPVAVSSKTTTTKTVTTKPIAPTKPLVQAKTVRTTTSTVSTRPVVGGAKVAPVRKPMPGAAVKPMPSRPGNPRPVMPLRPGVAPVARR